MNTIDTQAGSILITRETSDLEAIGAMVRAFFSYRFTAKPGEMVRIDFSRQPKQAPQDYEQEIIVTHRTPGPMVKVQNAFRAAWARLNANQCMVVKFEIRPFLPGGEND